MLVDFLYKLLLFLFLLLSLVVAVGQINGLIAITCVLTHCPLSFIIYGWYNRSYDLYEKYALPRL